jgi:hypothetical protein
MVFRKITYGIRDTRFPRGFVHYWETLPILERLNYDHDIPIGDPHNFLKSKRINDMLLQIFMDWPNDDLLVLDDDVYLGNPNFPFERLIYPTWIANPIGPENKTVALSTNSTNFYVPHRWQNDFIRTMRMYNEPTTNNDVFLFNHLPPYVHRHLLFMDGTFHAQSPTYCPILRTKGGMSFMIDNLDSEFKGEMMQNGWYWFEQGVGLADLLPPKESLYRGKDPVREMSEESGEEPEQEQEEPEQKPDEKSGSPADDGLRREYRIQFGDDFAK